MPSLVLTNTFGKSHGSPSNFRQLHLWSLCFATTTKLNLIIPKPNHNPKAHIPCFINIPGSNHRSNPSPSQKPPSPLQYHLCQTPGFPQLAHHSHPSPPPPLPYPINPSLSPSHSNTVPIGLQQFWRQIANSMARMILTNPKAHN